MDSSDSAHPHTGLDNSTPLRKKDLQNPAVVQEVQEMGANEGDQLQSVPSNDPERAKADIKDANKGVGGAGLAAIKPSQAEGGQTLDTGKPNKRPDPSTNV